MPGTLDGDRPLQHKSFRSVPCFEAGFALRVAEPVPQLRHGIMPSIEIRRQTRGLHPSLERLALGTGRWGALDLDDHVLRRPDAWPHAPDAPAHQRSQTHSFPLLERETGADGRG